MLCNPSHTICNSFLFLCPCLKGPQAVSNKWIIHPTTYMYLSFCHSVPLTVKTVMICKYFSFLQRRQNKVLANNFYYKDYRIQEQKFQQYYLVNIFIYIYIYLELWGCLCFQLRDNHFQELR